MKPPAITTTQWTGDGSNSSNPLAPDSMDDDEEPVVEAPKSFYDVQEFPWAEDLPGFMERLMRFVYNTYDGVGIDKYKTCL